MSLKSMKAILKIYSVTHGTTVDVFHFTSDSPLQTVAVSFVFFLYKCVNTITFGTVTELAELFLVYKKKCFQSLH